LVNRTCVLATAFFAIFLFFKDDARAWGCFAKTPDGAYGWSHNYPLRTLAERRALRECSKRSPSCSIDECREFSPTDWKAKIDAMKKARSAAVAKVVKAHTGVGNIGQKKLRKPHVSQHK